MPKPFSLKLIIKVLKKMGFIFISQKGSHVKFRKKGNPSITVIIPIHGKEIPYGTFRSIIRQANLNENDFTKK